MKKRLLSLTMVLALVASSFSSSLGILNVAAEATTTTTTTTTTTSEYRNVMYYGDWSIWGGQGNFYPEDMPADMYTHLNYAFMDFTASGDLVFTDTDAATAASLGQDGVTWGAVNAGLLPALTSLRADNPNMKIGISVGGWSKSGDFSAMAADDTARANFVSQIVAFIEYTGMDFVDIDWEYPASVREPDLVDNANDEGTPDATEADKENYIILLEDLRAALDEAGEETGKYYELSVALPIDRTKLENGVDVEAMFEIIDFGNLMTYDARGAWDETSGHQTALYGNPEDPMYEYGYSIDQTVDYMIENGAPSEKLVIGAAFYTRGWETVADDGGIEENPGLFGTASATNLDADQTASKGASNEAALSNGDGGRNGGIWSYNSIDTLKSTYTGLVEYWDDVAKAPYLYNGEAFFTYDNVESITEKANYVIENNLGGMISWMASNDATTDSTVRDELTTAIYEGLYGTASLPENEIIVTPLDISVSVSTYSESWSGTGYEITITNNEVAEETNAVLQAVEAQKETIMLPKLYVDTGGLTLSSGGYGAGTVTNEDGISIVDLSSVYDNKLIAQGASITIQLAVSGADELSVDDLQSITLVQSTYTGGPEINPQVIYGSDVQTEENSVPVFSGTSNRTLDFGTEFDIFEGVSATDNEDGDLTSQIIAVGSVDSNTAGTYTIAYTVTDSEGATATASRTITIRDEVVEPEVEEPEVEENTAPELSGVADAIIVDFAGYLDLLAGVSASDKEDGDLTDSIVVTGTVNTAVAGDYVITYTVTDFEGLSASATCVVTVEKEEIVEPEEPEVEENTAPVIAGVKDETVDYGSDFDTLAGVSASDEEDGDLTDSIKVEGSVDTSKAGDYTLTYSVTDSQGETVSISKTVTVLEEEVTPEPEVDEDDEDEDSIYGVDNLDFGVGDGIVWETGVFAPFADMGAWVTDADYSNNGALDLGQVMEDTGIKYFNLGFINAVDGTVDENGVLNWGFGAYEVLSEEHTESNAQYQGIKESIETVRENGGDVTISIGGLNEANFFQNTDDLDVLVNTYVEIIDGFNLTRIDLDIEGGAQGYEMNELNAKAIAIVQEMTGVEVVLTLPVLPEGLTTSLGLPTLQVYLDNGVDIEAVNIMAMCYGASYGDYADGSIAAIDSTMQQIKDAYASIGQTLTDEEAYMKVGVTTSVGYEGSAHPIFTVEDSQTVVDYAELVGINFVSFWSINRDSQTQSNTGIYEAYEHTEVYLGFQDESIQPDIPEGGDDEEEDYSDAPIWTRELEALGLYVPGYIVQHNGIVYKQVFSGTSWYCEPGTDSSIWLQIAVLDGTEEPEVEEPEVEENTAPELSGVADAIIVDFAGFLDLLAGVSASDKEDGDLTASIVVTGTVNTAVAGDYVITYTVTDSEGLSASATCVVTVEKEEIVEPEVEENTAPELSGVADAIVVDFAGYLDLLAGVSASDKEDGDLTASIVVTGTVNTAVAGDYVITYTVTDSEGLSASATCVVTVEKEEIVEPEEPEVEEPELPEVEGEYDTWTREDEATGAYTSGTFVTYKGVVYEQVSSATAWWCEPGTNSSVWQEVGSDDSYEAPAPEEWTRDIEATGAYSSGTVVTYYGNTYEQVSSGVSWWCEPGTNNAVWQLVN
ncbi:glycosyl hydrolase family 18 protein [Tannockella kyphosi]|uniref:glycosyl hydrolase family 18 protein n=1 Tax=Tannockella kyphosi TaxID=2899121 RepID=UPI0020124252|nr:glycosyl hydrolase family 18 protein [Tannockella kyphosi]